MIFGLFDPWWFVIVGPALLLTLWAQFRVKRAYHKTSKIPTRSGYSGAEAARVILDRAGLGDVPIEHSHGMLSDHYDPRHKVLRLSRDVYGGRTLASVGIAAHEAGHALQDSQHYTPLVVRNGLVPLAATGGQLSSFLIIGGILLTMLAHTPIGIYAIYAGIALFALTVIFQLINLPVEFNASSRAKAILAETGIVRGNEMDSVQKVLGAAAMTYVAATLVALMQLLYFVMLVSGMGGEE